MLNTFLQSNCCPVCGKALQLYLSFNKTLWKGSFTDNLLQFHKMFDDVLSEQDFLSLSERNEKFSIFFNTPQVKNLLLSQQFYFFKICASDVYVNNLTDDYDIQLDRTCHYQQSPFFEIVDDELHIVNPDHIDLINRDIIFTIDNTDHLGLQKVYVVNVSYEDNITRLFHWSSTPEQRNQESFEPQIFSKDLPLLPEFPSLELKERNKLIDRINSWIVLS